VTAERDVARGEVHALRAQVARREDAVDHHPSEGDGQIEGQQRDERAVEDGAGQATSTGACGTRGARSLSGAGGGGGHEALSFRRPSTRIQKIVTTITRPMMLIDIAAP